MDKVKELVSYMKINGDDAAVQEIQTAYRMKLVEAFKIQPGDKVLEIGCGQGDTTVVLADAAGKNGFVHAIDIAEDTYGSPFTLGEAAEHIRQSALGERIRIEFEVDVLAHEFQENYDVIVLSHCLWYLPNQQVLVEILRRAKSLGKRICLAEWDLHFENNEQRAHYHAVTIQALLSLYHETDANIRNSLTCEQVKSALLQANWDVQSIQPVDSSNLQDGSWEVSMVRTIDFNKMNVPTVHKHFLLSQTHLMEKTLRNYEPSSLNSFVILAE